MATVRLTLPRTPGLGFESAYSVCVVGSKPQLASDRDLMSWFRES